MCWTLPGAFETPLGSGVALLVREHGDQPAVAGIEVQVALGLVVEVRLLEDERHAEQPLPEVDRRLPVGPDDRDVVDALGLELLHDLSTSCDLYSLRRKFPHGTRSTRVETTSTLAKPLTNRFRERRVHGHAARELDADGKRRLLLDARPLGPDEDVAADPRCECAHDLAHGGREDVDASDDQHVVGPSDAAHPRPRAPARAWARPDLDVVMCAKPQQRRRLVTEMREDELAGSAVVERACSAALRIDQLRMDEAPRSQVHAVLLLALAPERDADVADAHRFRDPGPPAVLELCAKRRLAAAGLARDEHAGDARAVEIDVSLGRPLDEMRRVRRGKHDGLWLEHLDCLDEPVGVTGPDGDVAERRSGRTPPERRPRRRGRRCRSRRFAALLSMPEAA